MTKEPEYNAHVRCTYCHSVRPKSETIIFNNQTVCFDGMCLNKLKGASRVQTDDRPTWNPITDWGSI